MTNFLGGNMRRVIWTTVTMAGAQRFCSSQVSQHVRTTERNL